MFTGIVQETASITSISKRSHGGVLRVENPWDRVPKVGESISVDGSCLTVISANEGEISFDLSAETLEKTIFSSAAAGDAVNLEGALRLGDDVSGHFVQGHVDGIGTVVGLKREEGFATLSVRIPEEFAAYVVYKGSIAVNGVSLTIASIAGDVISVAVIPETLARTNLAALKGGDPVNIETDILGKHVVRYLSAGNKGKGASAALTADRLRELGY